MLERDVDKVLYKREMFENGDLEPAFVKGGARWWLQLMLYMKREFKLTLLCIFGHTCGCRLEFES